MSQHGPAEDRAILERRLDRWRALWLGEDIPEPEANLEGELACALLQGREWQPSEDAARLRDECLTAACRARFPQPTVSGP
jgi:hypothetical protein